MHRSRYYRNPAIYHPRGEMDTSRFGYAPSLSQISRSTYKRPSVVPFSPHKRDLNAAAHYNAQHSTFNAPRFPNRSKYVWTANQQQQTPSTSQPSQQAQSVPQLQQPQPQLPSQKPISSQPTLFRPQRPQMHLKLNQFRKNENLYHREISPLSVTVLDPVEEVIVDIAEKLQEQKVYIIRKVVDVIGVKKAIKLFYATRQKEANGGVLIQNGKRRRTPGGVYLTLLRECTYISPDEANKVFLEIKRYEAQLQLRHHY